MKLLISLTILTSPLGNAELVVSRRIQTHSSLLLYSNGLNLKFLIANYLQAGNVFYAFLYSQGLEQVLIIFGEQMNEQYPVRSRCSVTDK